MRKYRWLVTGLGALAACLGVVPGAGRAGFPGYYGMWPNVHWPSPFYHFTSGDGSGDYRVYHPGGWGGSDVVQPADLTWLRHPETALVEMRLPFADAEVQVDGKVMTRQGTLRRFVTPALADGPYTYQVRARWTQEDKETTDTRPVTVQRGGRFVVDFTRPRPR